LREFDGYSLSSFVVLHGDDGRIGHCAGVRIAPHLNPVFKFERQLGNEDRMLRVAKFQNRSFSQLGSAAAQGCHLHGHTNRRRTGEKARELLGAIDFVFVYGNFG
jgi:hypothetical protein